MIHDKDYMMRQIRQFSEFLATLILGKNEGKPEDMQLVFETQMKAIFKMDFEQLSSLPSCEIMELVERAEDKYHSEYYELLGHLFYYQFQQTPNFVLSKKTEKFYQLYLEKSRIFSIPVIKRLEELKKQGNP